MSKRFRPFEELELEQKQHAFALLKKLPQILRSCRKSEDRAATAAERAKAAFKGPGGKKNWKTQEHYYQAEGRYRLTQHCHKGAAESAKVAIAAFRYGDYVLAMDRVDLAFEDHVEAIAYADGAAHFARLAVESVR